MKKVSIVVHQNFLDNLVKSLHQSGKIQIINITKEEKDLLEFSDQTEADSDIEHCYNYELRLTRLIDILKKIKPKKGSIKAFLNPELPSIKNVEENTLDDILSYSEGILGSIEEHILSQDKELQKLTEEKENIKSTIEKIEFLKDFDFDISYIGKSDLVLIKAGITENLDDLKKQFNSLEKTELSSKQIGSGKKVKWSVVIVSHISESDKVERICKEKLNEFDFSELKGSPKQLIKEMENKIKNITKKQKQIKEELKKYVKDQLDDLLATREEIQIERARKEISKNFSQTNKTYIIKGWVLKKDQDLITDLINQTTDNHCMLNFETPSINPDNPPTYIKTPKWAEGFKGLVNMFSLPRYNEINPTIIMGIFFVLFFGIMLGDAGYGLVILCLSIFGYFKIGKHSKMIKEWSFMGLCMGLVTTVVGLLTNSLFGDFVPRFFYQRTATGEIPPLYSTEILGTKFPVDPIGDPITILVIALIFGLIQLNVGIILGIVQELRNKEYKNALTEKSCWIPLQIGGGLLILKFIMSFEISTILMYISAILVIIGLIQLFIAKGPIGFFDITGYVGDWLSYARLLALGLATAGMALAFNVVAEILGEMIPLIGIVITILLLVVAHMVNLGLQALGAGIHSLRLQYVEFFNRFYEGGGKEFSPFKINRKYTKIEDEK
jgi:V/A-type H+-transporting ATPase subunit I